MIKCFIHVIYSLTELPDCQVPLAMKPLVIDQILAMAMDPSYDCEAAQLPIAILFNVTESPGAHRFIVRKGVVKNMLEVCRLKQEMFNEQQLSDSLQAQRRKKNHLTALKYETHFSIP